MPPALSTELSALRKLQELHLLCNILSIRVPRGISSLWRLLTVVCS